MTSPVSPSLLSMQHDKTYYIHGGDLVFLVENILFRVHRYFFERESTFFRTLLEAPHPDNEPAQGSSDSTAIMLDTTAPQFSRFVWVFYNPKYSIYDEASLDDWKSILELAHRWLFPEVKELAIRELQKKPLTPVQRIVLYHRNFVDRKLLVGDYLTLCQRAEPLNLDEGLDLGLETTLTIARTREEIRSPRSPAGVMKPLTPTLQGTALTDHIGRMFVADGPSAIVQIAQPTTRPVNGAPNPNGQEKGGSNGPQTSGGLAPKGQTGRQTRTQNQNQPDKTQNQTRKDQTKNQQETPKTPRATTTQTNEEASKTVNREGKGWENKDKENLQIQTSVAGQQARGDENGPNSSTGTKDGPKVEGGVGAQGAGATAASNGDTAHVNGGGDKDKAKDETTDTQKTPSTAGVNHEPGTLASKGAVNGGDSGTAAVSS